MESSRGVLELFFWAAILFLGSKIGLIMVFSTLKKTFKNIKKSLLKPSHFRKKRGGNLRPQKIDQHEANQKKLQRALHDTPQHFSMGGGPATDGRIIYYLWSQVFARALCFLSCQTIKVHPNPNAFRMSPKSPLFKRI